MSFVTSRLQHPRRRGFLRSRRPRKTDRSPSNGPTDRVSGAGGSPCRALRWFRLRPPRGLQMVSSIPSHFRRILEPIWRGFAVGSDEGTMVVQQTTCISQIGVSPRTRAVNVRTRTRPPSEVARTERRCRPRAPTNHSSPGRDETSRRAGCRGFP